MNKISKMQAKNNTKKDKKKTMYVPMPMYM